MASSPDPPNPGSAEFTHSERAAPGQPRLARGRGAQIDPPNRFERLSLNVLGDHVDAILAETPGGRQIRTHVYADRTKRVINRVDSPDLGFHWTVNPYRGCEHGCIYCYARPGHEMLGFSCGLDFETRIVAKMDAPELLRRELSRASWAGEPIVFSGVTDPYQPIERKLRIMRRCVEVCVEVGQPISIITKSALILRDLDLLTRLRDMDAVRCAVSLTTLDNALAGRMEPRASAPAQRLRAIRALADAGVPTMAMTAPIIPGLNDREIPALLRAAKQAGAVCAACTLLRLPHQVKAVFLDWLKREFPERAAHVESLIRQTRSGGLSDPRFGARHRGEGAVADAIAAVFRRFVMLEGFDRRPRPMKAGLRCGGKGRQYDLFS